MKGNEKEQLSTMSRNRQDMKMNRQDTTTEEKKRGNIKTVRKIRLELDLCSEYVITSYKAEPQSVQQTASQRCHCYFRLNKQL